MKRSLRLIIAGMLCFIACFMVSDAGVRASEDDFNITVTVEKGSYGGTQGDGASSDDGYSDEVYLANVNVYNNGGDFSGYISLGITDFELEYEMPFTIAEKSEKDVTFEIPEVTLQMEYDVRFTVNIKDERKRTVATETDNVIVENSNATSAVNRRMGVLSDSADDISDYFSYSDSVITGYTEAAVTTESLTEADLTNGRLVGLTWLVINDYDTSTLTKAELIAIDDWVQNGGCLIIGTGANGYLSLNGLEGTTGTIPPGWDGGTYGYYDEYEYVITDEGTTEITGDVEVYDEATPGDAGAESADTASGDGQAGSETDDTEGVGEYYYNSIFEKDILTGDINYSGNIEYYESMESVVFKSYGDGSVAICFYDFSDPEILSCNSYMLYNYMSTLCTSAYDYTNYFMYDDYTHITDYDIEAVMSLYEKVPELHGTALRVVLFIYVLLIGPVIYVILKVLNKREKSIIILPVISLIFVGLVFLIGRTSMITGTEVQSVTVAEASGQGTSRVYFTAYGASSEEWEITLNEAFENAGKVSMEESFTTSYYYYSEKGPTVISDNGANLNISYKPDSTFEDIALYAQGDNPNQGSIDVETEGDNIIIINNTPYEFENYLIVVGGSVYCLSEEGLAPGEVAEHDYLAEGVMLGNYDAIENTFLYNEIYELFSGMNAPEDDTREYARSLGALYVGLMTVNPDSDPDRIYVFGSVKEYTELTADGCNETAWGSIYTVTYR